MPIVKLFTNKKINDDNFSKDFTLFLSTVLSKPNGAIFVLVKDQEALTLGGEGNDRVVVLELKAIGIINNTANVKFSEEITNYLVSKINAHPEKIIIDFVSLNPGYVGKQGTTVEELLKSKQ